MNTVLFVNATIGFSENLFLVYLFKTLFPEGNPISCKLIFPGALEKL